VFNVGKLILTATALVLATNHAQAGAAQLLYTLTGDTNVSFTLDAEPVPDAVYPDGFLIRNVDVTLNGIDQIRDVGFVRELSSGGFILLGTNLNLTGPQLFSGPFTSPTLLAGNFDLAGFNDPTRIYPLSVALVTAAVPEPQTWLLMVLGFGLAGAALRTYRISGATRGAPRGLEAV
jgi:hypothetical protein